MLPENDLNERPAYPVFPWQSEQDILLEETRFSPEKSDYESTQLPPEEAPRREKSAEVSLEEVPLLGGQDQYISELWKIQRLSSEEEDLFAERARTGDQEAKKALIENCLVYILHMARVYSVYVEHDDLLDIVAVGNLAVTEKVDQALEKAAGSVGAYLCGVAKRSISNYCLYRSKLIPISHATPIEEIPLVTSLDTLRTDGEGLPFDIPETEQYTPNVTNPELLRIVREALDNLTNKQREIVEMRYGFNTDTGDLRLPQVADHLAMKPDTAIRCHRRAIIRLQQLLPRMLSHEEWQPEGSEFVSAVQAAQLTGLNEKTIRNKVKTGELPADKQGRVYQICVGDLDKLSEPEGSEFVCAVQAAQLTGLDEKTIRNKLKAGVLQAAKKGGEYQIRLSDLEKLSEPEGSEFVSAVQAAQLTGLDEKTIRTRLKAGVLQAEKQGGKYQIRLSDLDKLTKRIQPQA
jgi:RNA polymerase sigma factor (sigma-70 family)